MTTKNPKKQQQQRRTCSIHVADCLARYARQKFPVDPKTGGIRIPDSFNLYHCVWHAMAKWPLEYWHIGVRRRADLPEGNLLIHLPNRRSEGGVSKDTRFWNYISPRNGRIIAAELKRLFDWEFQHYVDNLIEYRRDIPKKEAVRRFARKYNLGIDSEDALLKNYQRYERRKRIFLGLNKSKITPTSTTDLSSRVPSLLRFPYGIDDSSEHNRGKESLERVITQGLEKLCSPAE